MNNFSKNIHTKNVLRIWWGMAWRFAVLIAIYLCISDVVHLFLPLPDHARQQILGWFDISFCILGILLFIPVNIWCLKIALEKHYNEHANLATIEVDGR